MTAAISPEGYAFIVGGLTFLCTICVLVLGMIGHLRLRERVQREVPPELRPGPDADNEELALAVRRAQRQARAAIEPPVHYKAIGRVPVDESRAA
ncbi:MAG TPA: hypothetical protein VLC07_09270 [Solirubrobacterales bacterium]|nr:hypothetical protein [Solirubrobacterales bacterium]